MTLPTTATSPIPSLTTVSRPRGSLIPPGSGTARHIVKILDDCHYVVELAVSWCEIGLEPREDQTVMGIECARTARTRLPGNTTTLTGAVSRCSMTPPALVTSCWLGPRRV